MSEWDDRPFEERHPEMAEEGLSEEDLQQEVASLHVFRFQTSSKGDPKSKLNGRPVFIDNSYLGETVHPGDAWFCKVTHLSKTSLVYFVMPLLKVDYNAIMGMNSEIRNDVIRILWEENRDVLEKDMEERYRADVYRKALEDARNENQVTIDSLMARIDALNDQLTLARMVKKGSASSDDWLELSSDDEDGGVVNAESPVEAEDMPTRPVGQRRGLFKVRRGVPGMPEISRPETRVEETSRTIKLERVGEEQIWCGELEDGQYFVHITPSGKYLVIRPNPFGQVVCSNHILKMRGLGKYSTYTVPKELKGEYSAYYDGLVVTLGTKAQAQDPEEAEDSGEESDATGEARSDS